MIKYDSPRINEMNDFLQLMNRLSLQNPVEMQDNNIIYNEMNKYGLKDEDKIEAQTGNPLKKYFDTWQKKYKRSKKIHVYQARTKFLNFISYEEMPSDNFIKLYIPIDSAHIKTAVEKIFDFMEKLNIPHVSKVSDKMRSDNIVIRINKKDEEYAERIINFITNDSYISEGLNKNNPFIPTVKGIGYVYDNGESYNDEISKVIRDFLYFNRQDNINIMDISKFIEFCKNRLFYPEFKETFINATGNILTMSANNSQFSTQNDVYKNKIILEALRATYNKHGIAQVIFAIEQVFEHRVFSGITNENNYRNKLISEIGISYFQSFLKKTLVENNCTETKPTEIAKTMAQLLFSNSLNQTINKICAATYEKYGSEHIESAIYEYLKNDNPDGFTRFSQNDINGSENLRKLLCQIDNESFINGMINNIKIKGYSVETYTLDEIISLYVKALSAELGFKR